MSETLQPARFGGGGRRFLVALAETILPQCDALDISLDEDDLLRRVGLSLGAMPASYRWASRFCFFAFQWLCVFRYLRPFSSLDERRRQAWLRAWNTSRFVLLRFTARLILTLVKPAIFARRVVKEKLGYAADRLDDITPEQSGELRADRVIRAFSEGERVRTQVVVIGSGAGGAVVAAELAERGLDVVLLEEGHVFHTSELGTEPTRNLRETYRDGGATIAFGRPPIPIPLGKTVGGTTTINSGTCFRVPDRILDKWQAAGLPLDREALSRAYDRVEARISVKTVPHELLGGSSHVIARGAEALGLKHGPLQRNIEGCGRSGCCAFGCPRGAKQSMNLNYVPRALEAGATLYTGVRAERVRTSGGRAVGVSARHRNGQRLIVDADVVVSACGAIAGVAFLKNSGLRSKHLGRHLTIHPATKIAAIMPERVDGWEDTPQGYGIYDYAEEGILFEGAFLPPEYTSLAFPFAGQQFSEVMAEYRRLALFGLLVADEPMGRVRRSVSGRPLITYWMSRGDVKKMQRGLSLLAKVFFAAGAQRIYLPLAGREEQATLAGALAALQGPLSPWDLELLAFHPLGTARTASQPSAGVLRPTLETWELPGLYVIDGSVFPSSLGVNPQLTIMAFATLASARIAEAVS